MDHVRSYYAASANPAPLRAPLRGEATADVCVVGGGIAGCSTALHLAEPGYKVVLLEGKRIAVERNGAIVPRSRYAETALADGDRLEIVGAVGGG